MQRSIKIRNKRYVCVGWMWLVRIFLLFLKKVDGVTVRSFNRNCKWTRRVCSRVVPGIGLIGLWLLGLAEKNTTERLLSTRTYICRQWAGWRRSESRCFFCVFFCFFLLNVCQNRHFLCASLSSFLIDFEVLYKKKGISNDCNWDWAGKTIACFSGQPSPSAPPPGSGAA